MSLADIITDPHTYLEDLFGRLEALNLDVSPYYLDHICYRVATQAEYDEKKIALLTYADLIIESMVNGRMISTYKLHSPIIFKDRKIDVLELPAPKPGHTFESALEHVEFVTTGPLKDLVDKYSALPFQTAGIDKELNADITLKLPGLCIRFHNQSLEEVIEIEKKLMPKN